MEKYFDIAGAKSLWVKQPAEESRLGKAVRIEQAVTMMGQTPFITAASLINPLILVILFWPLADKVLLLGWAGFVWGFCLLWLYRWRRRKLFRPDRVGPGINRRLVRYAVIGGLVWATGAVLLFPSAPLTHQVFLAFVCGGMAAGAAMSLSAVPLATAAFIVCSMAPLTAMFALQGTAVHIGMALMLALFSVLAVMIARTSFIRFLESVRISQSNADLLAELADTRADLLDLIASMPVAFALFDKDDRLLLCSDNVEAFLSGGKEKAANTTETQTYERVKRALADYRRHSGTVELQLPDGRWVQAGNRPTRRSGSITVLVDITELKIAEQALRSAKETAEQANEMKSRFLATASHDLRQPLQALDLLVGSLSKAADDENRGEIIADMGHALRIMADMLNGLLDISKLDAGAVVPEIEDIPIQTLFRRMEYVFGATARAKGLSFRVVPCSLSVRSDPVLLERVVENLLANAVRYTESGKVLLGCRRRGDMLRIDVWDTGIGIPQEHFRQIFEEYYQLGNPSRDRDRGLGVGLAIVDRVARLLDHPIEVHSTVGHGSRFTVTVPMAETEAVTECPLLSPVGGDLDLDGTTLVVIDDDEMVLRATDRLLRKWGAGVIAAPGAEEALASIAEIGVVPDLIVADHRLGSGKTGSEAIRSIEAFCETDLPSIIITGDTAGAGPKPDADHLSHVLYKPVDPAKLRSLIRHMLLPQAIRQAAHLSSPGAAG
ncbi:MAG: ATP-binding protein [Minwuiales bacterium]|nr:ATP-binding protein [Minwuiales bacterium]